MPNEHIEFRIVSFLYSKIQPIRLRSHYKVEAGPFFIIYLNVAQTLFLFFVNTEIFTQITFICDPKSTISKTVSYFFLCSYSCTYHCWLCSHTHTPLHIDVSVITRKRAKAMQQDLFHLTLIMNSPQAACWPLEQITFGLILLPEQWWIVKNIWWICLCLGHMRIIISLQYGMHVDCSCGRHKFIHINSRYGSLTYECELSKQIRPELRKIMELMELSNKACNVNIAVQQGWNEK